MKTSSNELMNFLIVKLRKKSESIMLWVSERGSNLLTSSFSARLSSPSRKATALNSASALFARFGVLAWAALASARETRRTVVDVTVVEVVALFTAGAAVSWWASAHFDVVNAAVGGRLTNYGFETDVTDARFRCVGSQGSAHENAFDLC